MSMYDDEEFLAYYQTPHWIQMRRRTLDYYGHECAVCGNDWNRAESLDVHHLFYWKNGSHIHYHETLADLRPLCRTHHRKGKVTLAQINRASKWYRRKKFVKWVLKGIWGLVFRHQDDDRPRGSRL